MRSIIHDKVLHKFIEGPLQAKSSDSSFKTGSGEKATYHSDFAKGNDGDHINEDIFDRDMPFYAMNERQD